MVTRFRSGLWATLGLIASCPVLATPPPDPLAEAAIFAERMDFNSAAAVLDAAAENDRDHGATPSARLLLARAITLLGTQPRTQQNVRAALADTRAIAHAADTPPELGVTARYLEARILHRHLEPADLPAAAACYRALLASPTDHPLARHAAAPLALILLHDHAAEPDANARLANAEALLPLALSQPRAVRDLRFVLAHARLEQNLGLAEAREHLRRVDAIGFTQTSRRLSTRVTLGLVAEETGDLPLARDAFRAFLAEAVRDVRAPTIREHLRSVEARLATPASTATATSAATPASPASTP